MDKIVKSLILLMMTLMEVCLLSATYILGIIYTIYMSIRGKKKFKETFIELSKELINGLRNILDEYRKFISKAA